MIIDEVNKGVAITTIILALLFLFIGGEFWMLTILVLLMSFQFALTAVADLEKGDDIFRVVGIVSLYICGMLVLGLLLYTVFRLTALVSQHFEKSMENLIVESITIVIALFSGLSIYNIMVERKEELEAEIRKCKDGG